ncbi:MAG: hypothetical protein M1828_006223 [Chrysothrix sp. TS-e1954]|nr:MAG: hypothetical protein M1828_006223 [Chrysothrix sp. TS-e1954]
MSSPMNLASIPAASHIPQGVTPDFLDPYSRCGIFFAVCTPLEVIMLLFVLMRIKAKFEKFRRLTLDDYLCIAGAFFTTSVYILYSYLVTESRFGTHFWNLSLLFISLNELGVPTWLAIWFLNLAYLPVKMTFFAMYLDIFRPFWWMRIVSYLGLLWVFGLYFSVLIAQLYASSPDPGQSFSAAVTNDRYKINTRTAVPLASVGLAIDIVILLLPLAGVSQLQMSTRRRLGVGAVFLTGSMACIASAVGLCYRVKLDRDPNDLTWTTFPVLVTACVECQVGTICSCMPASSSLVRNMPMLFSGLRSKAQSSYSRLVGKSSAPRSRTGASGTRLSGSINYDAEPDSLHDSLARPGRRKKSYDIEMCPWSLPNSAALPPLDINTVSITHGFEQYSTPRSILDDFDPLSDQSGYKVAQASLPTQTF